MIFAELADAPRYRGIHPMLDRALELLTPDFLATVGTERQELSGEALFVTRFDVESVTDEGRLFEHHRRYLDIFTLTRGRERVDLAPSGTMELRAQQNDYWGGVCETQQSLTLTPGSLSLPTQATPAR